MSAGKKINILFVLPNFDTGGSEKLVMDIIRNLDKGRFSPILAVFFTGTYESEYRKLGLPFYVIHKEGIRSKVSTFFFLREIMRRHSVDVVNTHHTSPLIQGLLPCKVLAGAALVHTEHSPLCYDRNIHDRALFLEKIFLKRVDAALGISKGVCDYFRDELKVPQKRIRMILNGVDLKRFDLRGFDAAAYRRKAGLPADAFLIGLFANFRTEKNHGDLIRAFSLLKGGGRRDIRLALCGGGPTEAEARELVSNLGIEEYVHFMGVRMDIPELMNSIDLYCLPSRYEGLPFSALEAMASEKPVVGADVTGINGIIRDGENGLLASPPSPQTLAAKIGELMDDEKKMRAIAERGKAFVKGFSFDKMMSEYESLFSEMAYLSRNRA